MIPTVTFETQCYENDYEHILKGDRLQKEIQNCNHNFAWRHVIINKVYNRRKVAALAESCKQKGLIDDYYFAEDYIDQALQHFGIKKSSFREGAYAFSRCQLVGLYLCKTDYLLHFTTDSYIKDANASTWVKDAIVLMEKYPKYACATPLWNHSLKGARAKAIEQFGDWFAGYGFSDNCYLVPSRLFKQQIYNEYNPASDRYPTDAGERFEKRVDSFMRNHGYLRLVNTTVSYIHSGIPKKRLQRVLSAVHRPLKRGRNGLKLLKHKLTRQRVNPMEGRTAAIRNAPGMKEYRRQIKIYDVFTFFNELDLLEMHLQILEPHVDYFVIVECTETFSGLPKPLYYQQNKERFKRFHHKIIHHVTPDSPLNYADLRRRLKNKSASALDREIIQLALTSDNVPPGQIHWLKEFYQKESIRKALIGLRDEDICFVGDVDEIWNPEAVIDYRSDDIFKLRQDVYAYYLNNRSSEPWAGTLVTKYKNIKSSCLNHLRTVSKTPYTYIRNGGWHFTNQGGADQIRRKLESYGHQEFNNEAIKSDLERKMKVNRDFIGRTFKFWVDESSLPNYIQRNKKKYQEFFK